MSAPIPPTGTSQSPVPRRSRGRGSSGSGAGPRSPADGEGADQRVGEHHPRDEVVAEAAATASRRSAARTAPPSAPRRRRGAQLLARISGSVSVGNTASGDAARHRVKRRQAAWSAADARDGGERRSSPRGRLRRPSRPRRSRAPRVGRVGGDGAPREPQRQPELIDDQLGQQADEIRVAREPRRRRPERSRGDGRAATAAARRSITRHERPARAR